MPKKIFIVACEASGDNHGAHLVKALKDLDASIEFCGTGGPAMEKEGVRIFHDMTRISALGFGDVLRQYFTYRKIFYDTLDRIRDEKPDVIVMIDSPAFNLRLAKKIKKRVPVVYYIAPQLWAWGARRIHTVKRTVSKVLSILPFEVEYYEEAGMPCEFVGHPLLDEIHLSKTRDQLRKDFSFGEQQRAIGLLPGSREREVRRILPVMLKAARLLHEEKPETVFVIFKSANVKDEIYDTLLASYSDLTFKVNEGHHHDGVHALDFALVTSGTATLETALLGTPFFLLYRTSWSTYFLGKQLIRVPYLGLVNLLAGKRVVPEFIQNDACAITIAHEARVLLNNRELYESMKEEFLKIREVLGQSGGGKKAAEAVLSFLSR